MSIFHFCIYNFLNIHIKHVPCVMFPGLTCPVLDTCIPVPSMSYVPVSCDFGPVITRSSTCAKPSQDV